MKKGILLFFIVGFTSFKIFGAAEAPLQPCDFPVPEIKVVKCLDKSRPDKIKLTNCITIWESSAKTKYKWIKDQDDNLTLELPIQFSRDAGFVGCYVDCCYGETVTQTINSFKFKLITSNQQSVIETYLNIETHYSDKPRSPKSRPLIHYSPPIPQEVFNRCYLSEPIHNINFVLNKNDELCFCFYDDKKVELAQLTRSEKYKFCGVSQ